MRVIVVEPGKKNSGSGYPFTLSRWLTDEARHCVSRSEWFEQEYGWNWTLALLLMTNTRLKKPQVYKAKTNRKKEVCYCVLVPYVGSSWTSPARYAQPVRQWLEGIVTALRLCHFDSSAFEKRIPSLLRQFRSDPDRIVPEWVEPATPKPRGLPKWRVPKDLRQRLADGGGTWEDERYDPLLLTVSDDVSYQGRAIPLMWQVEFDPFDERLEGAAQRLENRGVEPDGDGWSGAIQKRFKTRFAKLAGELHDDSESSTCVLWVESERACKALLGLVWLMLFQK
jgi:hypothetical protein